MKRRRTTAAIDPETWKTLEALRKEMRMSKQSLIRIAVKHLADCEDAKRGLSLLGYDAEAIADIISKDLSHESVLLPAS